MTFVMNRSIRPIVTCLLNHSPKYVRYNSSNPRPMMLMDLPRIVYPNLFLTIKNFFARMLISTYFDSTFAIKPFSDGARQAVTVVSRLIGNEQFDDLSGFVTDEVINEIKRNYSSLSPEQKQKIPTEESEIVFAYPYLIGFIMGDQPNNRLVEVTMIFHILKNRESYQEEMLNNTGGNAGGNWSTAMKKMRDNIVVCNYKFLRDMSKNAKDDSWVISGLNHWLPIEYEQEQQQQQQQ